MPLVAPVTSKDHIRGNSQALVTIVEYADYQCPYCAGAYPTVKIILEHFGDKLRLVFRNFPLAEVHPLAEIAAEAAEFAAERGVFWEMHDLIYENQRLLSLQSLLELGSTLKLPTADLEKAILNKIYGSKIQEDFLSGVKSGVNGTPTFFINDRRYDGSLDIQSLVDVIDLALSGRQLK